jgi:hypothetical protein
MLMAAGKGNLEQVRAALQGITGTEPVAPKPEEWWYMLVVRPSHEFEAVDSLRRHGFRAYWPSYERLISTRRRFEGRPIRRLVRIGILPYVLSPVVDDIDLEISHEKIVSVVAIVRTFSGKPLFLRGADMAIIRKLDVKVAGLFAVHR